MITMEEYKEQNKDLYNSIMKAVEEQNKEHSEPKFKCPKCSTGSMRKNQSIVLCSYPPKYEYKCDCCGHIEYLHY